MRPSSQIIRGETVVHSIIDKESLQMCPLSQIIRGETVVHFLIDRSHFRWVHHHKLCKGNCRILFN